VRPSQRSSRGDARMLGVHWLTEGDRRNDMGGRVRVRPDRDRRRACDSAAAEVEEGAQPDGAGRRRTTARATRLGYRRRRNRRSRRPAAVRQPRTRGKVRSGAKTTPKRHVLARARMMPVAARVMPVASNASSPARLTRTCRSCRGSSSVARRTVPSMSGRSRPSRKTILVPKPAVFPTLL